MKKELILVIFFVLVLSFFVLAEEQTNQDAAQGTQNKVGSTFGDISSNITSIFEQELGPVKELPPYAKFILGIKEDVRLSVLVVIVALWIMCFLIIYAFTESFFSRGILKIVVPFGITWGIALSGGIQSLSSSLFNFSKSLKILGAYPGVSMFLLLVILAIITYFILHFVSGLGSQNSALTAYTRGKDVGATAGALSTIGKKMSR